MTTTATHTEHDTIAARVLFVAFALSEKTGSSALPSVTVKSHVSARSQRVTRRACSKKWPRPQDALVSWKARR